MLPAENASLASDDSGIRLIATFDAKLQCYTSKYTFLLCYFLSNLVLFFFGAVDEHIKWRPSSALAWIAPLARGTGNILNLNIALEFLFASKMSMGLLRNTIISNILPIDEVMPEMHSIIGFVSFGSSIIHGLFHTVAGILAHRWEPGFGKWSWCFGTGVVLLSAFAAMISTAIPFMRRKNHERFMAVHILGAVLFIPLLCIHGFYNGKLYSYKWIAGPALVYGFDRAIRKISERSSTVRIHVSSAHRHLVYGQDIVRLSFQKPFKYKAGQYAEICIPLLSKHQWHPFTIASAPHEEDIVFFIKGAGDWTTSLHHLCNLGNDPKSGRQTMSFDIKVRGPFGAPAQHVGQYDRILLISGGVGSTPFCSITKHINEVISRQYVKKVVRQDSGSSMSTVDLNDDEGGPRIVRAHTAGPVHFGCEASNLSDIGMTVNIEGIYRPKRPMAGAQPEVRKNPTLGRNLSKRMSPVPVQSWAQFFHTMCSTVTFNTLALWMVLIRFSICLLGIAFLQVDLEEEGAKIFESGELSVIDLLLTAVSFTLLTFSVTTEWVSENRVYVEDVLILMPLSVVPLVFHSLGFSSISQDSGLFAKHYFYIIWPLYLCVAIYRYFRVLGRRAFLTDTVRKSHQTTKSVDFIWTTPTREDDAWLIDELSCTLGKSQFVRLHRFITREQTPDIETGQPHSHIAHHGGDTLPDGGQLCKDHFGRPDWKQVFERFTSKMKNGTTAGIFFCGPPAMAAAVRQAAMHAMLDSRYRGLSNHAKEPEPVDAGSLLCPQEQEKLLLDALTRSFNVRYVFREEKF